MARYKAYNYDQIELIPVSFAHQILPGSFEHALVYLIDEELDLSLFDARYSNDHNGRRAYDPAILLKIILLAYSRGVTSSRKIEALCRENVLFMAISANSTPHFTTIADFISRSAQEIQDLFVQILMICDEQGLIGREMFAIDGCKIPSNASKKWSGTHKDLLRKKQRLDQAVETMLEKHRQEDLAAGPDEVQRERETKRIEGYKKTSAKIKAFLESTEDKIGRKGKAIQGNVTDHDSAKMKSSQGVIQGYIGVAAVDAKHQVILSAEAFGESTEHGLLEPMLEQTQENLDASDAEMQDVKILADSGYHNKGTLKYVAEYGLDAYIADNQMRARDERFNNAKAHYKPEQYIPRAEKEKFTREDFFVDLKARKCVCPAGNILPMNVESTWVETREMIRFRGLKSQCESCHLRAKCLRNPEQNSPRAFSIVKQTVKSEADYLVVQMQKKIDSEKGQSIYSQRLGLIEPVFGHLRSAIGLKRFSLRGKTKVTLQWRLFAVVHNALKWQRFGFQGG